MAKLGSQNDLGKKWLLMSRKPCLVLSYPICLYQIGVSLEGQRTYIYYCSFHGVLAGFN